MYETDTRSLKQAVRRNLERFPDDFMFQLSKEEWKQLITICDNLPETIKFSPATPFAFTELACPERSRRVAMLSSVLNSKKAIQVNIAVIRAFVVLRQHLADYKDLKENIAILEKQMNLNFKDINQALHYLLNKDKQQIQQEQRKQIGFNK
jgi:hypothetical protein